MTAIPETNSSDAAMFSMPLDEAMSTQRAIRRLKTDPVDDALVLRLIELALKAPTGSNAQNWEFVVVRDRAVKERLGALNRGAWRLYGGLGRCLSRKDPKMLRLLDAVQWQADHFDDIPVIVVACLRGPRVPFPPVAASSYYGSIYPSVQNLLLAARSAGLGAALITLPLWSTFLARRALGLAVERSAVRGGADRLAARQVRSDHAASGRRGRARRPLRQPAVPRSGDR